MNVITCTAFFMVTYTQMPKKSCTSSSNSAPKTGSKNCGEARNLSFVYMILFFSRSGRSSDSTMLSMQNVNPVFKASPAFAQLQTTTCTHVSSLVLQWLPQMQALVLPPWLPKPCSGQSCIVTDSRALRCASTPSTMSSLNASWNAGL